MEETVKTIQLNWSHIVVIILAARELLKAIVVMTKTKKDDKWFAKIDRLISYLIVGKRD